MEGPTFFPSLIGGAGRGDVDRDDKPTARVYVSSHMDDCYSVFNKKKFEVISLPPSG